MKLNESPKPPGHLVNQIERPSTEPHVLVKPYILPDFIYHLEGSHKTDLELPVGTQVTIQRNREFPGKVWLIGKIEIETPVGKISARLARLIPESDLHYFAPSTAPETQEILENTAERINESVDD